MFVFICIKSSEARSNRSSSMSVPSMNSLFESSLSPLCDGAHRPHHKQIINKSSRHKSLITHRRNIIRRWRLTSFVLEVLGVFPHERDPKICNDNRQGIRAQKNVNRPHCLTNECVSACAPPSPSCFQSRYPRLITDCTCVCVSVSNMLSSWVPDMQRHPP